MRPAVQSRKVLCRIMTGSLAKLAATSGSRRHAATPPPLKPPTRASARALAKRPPAATVARPRFATALIVGVRVARPTPCRVFRRQCCERICRPYGARTVGDDASTKSVRRLRTMRAPSWAALAPRNIVVSRGPRWPASKSVRGVLPRAPFVHSNADGRRREKNARDGANVVPRCRNCGACTATRCCIEQWTPSFRCRCAD